MEVPESTKERFVIKLGERIGFLIVIVIAIVFLSFQGAEQARSEEVTPNPNATKPPQVSPENSKVLSQTDENVKDLNLLDYPQVTEDTLTESQSKIQPTTTKPPTTPTQVQQKSNVITKPTSTPTQTSIPTQTPTPTPTPTPEPTTPPVDPNNDAIWDQISSCEAGNNWATDTGNGYYGGLQFSQSAWESVGGTGNPAQASREEQIMRGKMLRDRRGSFSAWGACAARLGLP